MDPDALIDALHRPGVAQVCPACGNPTGGGNLVRVDLGGPFIGLS
ncbi:MAG TPA: hypothetical protein VH231_15955 [Solirubrobacteraceae bacterium]|jgi:hypothetical protein|nr:hypothetical protein [Solirubrobacteraceae bacterium]